MTGESEELFNQRLGRYQAAIALEDVDRVPISGFNWFADAYSGGTLQEFVYDSGEKWTKAVGSFLNDFPEVDTLSASRIWGPCYDIVGAKTYKLPGRDLPPDHLWQYVEEEYMKADEYDLFIGNPMEFFLERYLPRVFGELADRGSNRSYISFLKSGMAFMAARTIAKNRLAYLEKKGMPPTTMGRMNAPFDYLGDYFRGLRGISIDLFRCPDKVLQACDKVTDILLNATVGGADTRYPVQMTFHKATSLSSKQFDTFYWPSLKRAMVVLIEAGYTIRAVMEGNWGLYWHHMLELPKGKVLCDIGDQGDIFRAKEEIGHHQCLAGGVPVTMLMFGKPVEVEERVKLLCQRVGKNGGYIINSGCGIPRGTKPENYRAMVKAAVKFGTYDSGIKPFPKVVKNSPKKIQGIEKQKMFTPWNVKLAELGGEVLGQEELIRDQWEKFESLAFNWCLLWG